jgi:molybdenum cofactor guanylyltransferase
MTLVEGRISGVILAGGQGRRMGGRDKGLLRLGGETLTARAIRRLRHQVDGLAINANGDAARFAGHALPVLADSIGGFAGPLAGVLAGLDWAAGTGATHIVTVAVDTPFFPSDLVARLRDAATKAGRPIAMAATPHPTRGLLRQPTFALWPVSLRGDLRAALGNDMRKIVMFSDLHGTATAGFDTDPHDPFFNVNTPQDLQLAETFFDQETR